MELEKLTQDEEGYIIDRNGMTVSPRRYDLIAIKTLVVKHPCDIDEEIQSMANRNSVFIPKEAMRYITSKFNPDTQHVRKDEDGKEHFFSVYGVQFLN